MSMETKPKLPDAVKSKNRSISLRPFEWELLDEAAKRNKLYRSAVVKVLIRQASEHNLPIFRKDAR